MAGALNAEAGASSTSSSGSALGGSSGPDGAAGAGAKETAGSGGEDSSGGTPLGGQSSSAGHPGIGGSGGEAGSSEPVCTDADGDGFCAQMDDCDDVHASAHPGSSEVCTPSNAAFGDRAVDENCDGRIDEDCAWYFGRPQWLTRPSVPTDVGTPAPLLSANGLRLYLRKQNGLLVAERSNVKEPFGPSKSVSGSELGTLATLSPNELEGYFVAPTTKKIVHAVRKDLSSPFGQALDVDATGYEKDIVEHSVSMVTLSADAFELLYFWGAPFGVRPNLQRSTRTTSDEAFSSSAAAFTVNSEGNWPTLSRDERALFYGFATFDPGNGVHFHHACRIERADAASAAFASEPDCLVLDAGPGDFYAQAPSVFVSEATGEMFVGGLVERPWTPKSALWRIQICRDAPCDEPLIACPDGVRSPDGNHCYTVPKAGKPWAEAYAACKATGGHLATLHSLEEAQTLAPLVDGPAMWIGGYDAEGPGGLGLPAQPSCNSRTDCKFAWETGEVWQGTTEGFFGSDPSGNGDCLSIIKTGLFHDRTCAANYGWVCETEQWPNW